MLVVNSLLWINPSHALDWKPLHEKADTLTLSAAMAGVQARPDSIEDLYVLGLVNLNFHKDKEAAATFDKILALNPAVIEAQWGQAEVLRRRHQPDKSEELLREVIKAKPDFPAAYITLAYIRYLQINFKAAVKLAVTVLNLGDKKVDQSNHARAHLVYGGVKAMIAHYGGPVSKLVNGTAVLPSLKSAERLQPETAGVKFGLGSFYLLAPAFAGGDLQKAEEYLTRAIEIDPLFIEAYVRLGQVYKLKGENSKYNEYLDKALALDPENELALDVQSGRCKFICPDKGQDQ